MPPDAGVVVVVGPAVAGVVEDEDGEGPMVLAMALALLLVLMVEVEAEELIVVLMGLMSGLANGPDRGLATFNAMMPDADMLIGP